MMDFEYSCDVRKFLNNHALLYHRRIQRAVRGLQIPLKAILKKWLV